MPANDALFDPSPYFAAPRVSVPSAVSLGISLIAVTPKPAPQMVRRAAERLRDAVLELQQEWRRNVAAELAPLPSPRDADTRVDRAFRALSMRLEALTILPGDLDPDVERARSAHERLFSDGLVFLTLPFAQQWAHCDRVLATLDDDEDLLADVERIVGELVLGEVRAAQEAYGEALGITTGKRRPDPVSLVRPLEAVRAAIASYCVQLIALQADDPARLPDVRRAVAPIDDLRAAQGRRPTAKPDEPEPIEAADEAVDVTPDTPVPAVDDGPASS